MKICEVCGAKIPDNKEECNSHYCELQNAMEIENMELEELDGLAGRYNRE